MVARRLGDQGGNVAHRRAECVPSLELFLKMLMEQHDVGPEAKAGVTATMSPFRHAGRLMAQIEFEINHPTLAISPLVDTVVGVGATWGDALRQAMGVFLHSSLHPLAAALWDPNGDHDHVEREIYEHPGTSFEVILGRQLQVSTGATSFDGGKIIDALLGTLGKRDLSANTHSLRVIAHCREGELTAAEVVVDGQPWPEGVATVAAIEFSLSAEPVALRVLAMLAPLV